MNRRKGKTRKPKAVNARSMSASSVVSDLSNPSDHSGSSEDEVSIPDAIAEEESSYDEEDDDEPVNPRQSTFNKFEPEDDNINMSSNLSKKKTRKSTVKKKKSPRKGGSMDDDDDSADDRSTKSGKSSKSAKSSRSSKRGGKKKKKKKKKTSMDDITESDDEEFLDEFEALQEEVLSLRRKLSMKDDNMEMTQLQMDMKRAENEAHELKSEIDEYEEAVAEKDGLIKKLTEAVDCQLDKVEYLELKLQRAEEEFVKMEDEMGEMEDEIEELRVNGGGGSIGGSGGVGGGAAINGEQSAELLERERDLEERENDLLMKEQELLDREKTLVDREESIEIEEEKLSDQKDDLRMKELQFEEREREQLENNQITSGGLVSTYELDEKQEEINTLKRNLAMKTGEVHELRGQLSRGLGSTGVNANALREENDRLKVRLSNYESQEKDLLQSRNDEIRNIQKGAEKQMQDLFDQNETLKRRVEALTLEQADIQHSDVNDQLRKKDEFAMRQQQELEQVYQENDELKEDLADTAQKLKKAELQVREFKGSANKKTKQKDETIDFLQGEMVRLTMEKKQFDKDLQEKVAEIEMLQLKFANVGQDEEAEMMRIQAFTEQIRALDEVNQELQGNMKKMEKEYSKQLEEKENVINEMQNSKAGGYARSRIQLSQAQGELRQSKDRIEELEATIEDLRRQKDYKGAVGGRANGTTSNGGLGVFGKNPKPAETAKSANGRWGWGGKAEQNESTYDQNNRINMVPHASPHGREKSVVAAPIIGGPIITGQSIEDELAAIEADAKRYEDAKRSDRSHQSGNMRVDMTGKLKSSLGDDDSNEVSSKSSASSNGSVGMDIASRLEAMRARRNRGKSGR